MTEHQAANLIDMPNQPVEQTASRRRSLVSLTREGNKLMKPYVRVLLVLFVAMLPALAQEHIAGPPCQEQHPCSGDPCGGKDQPAIPKGAKLSRADLMQLIIPGYSDKVRASIEALESCG